MLNKNEIKNEFISRIGNLLDPLNVIEIKTFPVSMSGKNYDLLVSVEFADEIIDLIFVITANSEPRYVEQAVSRLKIRSNRSSRSYPVYGSLFIGKRSRDICTELDVGYIDLNGNIFLALKNFHIEKESNKNIIREKKELKNMFSPVSTRILRRLLIDTDVSWTTKSLSEGSGASIGYTHRVVEKLKDKKFIERDSNYRLKLIDPANLLERWREEYTFRKNKIQPFYSFQKDERKLLREIDRISNEKEMEYALTMHVAGRMVAPYVRSKEVHFYIGSSPKVWKEELDLRPVESGANIYLMEPYDSGIMQDLQVIDGLKIVSNLQLYLDLYNYPKRGREQAEFIREKRLKY